MKEEKALLRTSEIVVVPKLYSRDSKDDAAIDSYAQAMKMGEEFPSIVVGLLDGKKVLIDGLHRLRATQKIRKQHISAIVRHGLTEGDIYLEAVKANLKHGVQYTNGDRRRIIRKFTELNIDPQLSAPIKTLIQSILSLGVAARSVSSTLTGEKKGLQPKKPLRGFSLQSFEIQAEVITDAIQLFKNPNIITNGELRDNVRELKELINKISWL